MIVVKVTQIAEGLQAIKSVLVSLKEADTRKTKSSQLRAKQNSEKNTGMQKVENYYVDSQFFWTW